MKITYIVFLSFFYISSPLQAEEEKNLNVAERFWPIAGLFYQTHLGPTVTIGTAYTILEKPRDDILDGPYIEAGFGTHGFSSDIGWMVGAAPGLFFGASLSYINIKDSDGYFHEGHYIGLSIKGTLFVPSLRAGVFHEPKLNDTKVNVSIGLGF